MKKILALLAAVALSVSLVACANSTTSTESGAAVQPESTVSSSTEPAEGTAAVTGETLADWKNDAGWTAFYTFTENENLNDAWEAGAKAFGPVIGMADLDGAGLKAMNVQVCGFDDGITHLDISGDRITAKNGAEETVFEHSYTYVETVANAVEGQAAYIYKTEDADAGNYTYLCMTLPSIASDEGGIIASFSIRHGADNCEALCAADYSGKTCAVVPADTTEADIDYTIRAVYGANAEQ